MHPKPVRRAKPEGSPLGLLRTEVINRDRQCVAALLDLTHECRDKYGDRHPSTALLKLTLEHVKLRGKRIDSALHCVAMCSEGNVQQHWSSPPENNRLANAYLAGVAAAMGVPR